MSRFNSKEKNRKTRLRKSLTKAHEGRHGVLAGDMMQTTGPGSIPAHARRGLSVACSLGIDRRRAGACAHGLSGLGVV